LLYLVHNQHEPSDSVLQNSFELQNSFVLGGPGDPTYSTNTFGGKISGKGPPSSIYCCTPIYSKNDNHNSDYNSSTVLESSSPTDHELDHTSNFMTDESNPDCTYATYGAADVEAGFRHTEPDSLVNYDVSPVKKPVN